MVSPLEQILILQTDNERKKWNWDFLSSNPNISWSFIKKNPNFDWNWDLISCRIDPDLIEKDSSNYLFLSKNPKIQIDFVIKNLDKEWNWDYLSSNPGIKIRDISKFPHLPWSWFWISSNPNLKWSFVKKNIDKKWDWERVLLNPQIKVEEIERQLVPLEDEKYWSYISINPRLNFKVVEENLDKPWNWKQLSRNPSLNTKLVERYPEREWDWSVLSSLVPVDFITQNLDKPWNWRRFSSNQTISIDFIQNRSFPIIRFDIFFSNWKISCHQIERFLEKNEVDEFFWLGVSLNPNLDLPFIFKYYQNIDWIHLSRNQLNYDLNLASWKIQSRYLKYLESKRRKENTCKLLELKNRLFPDLLIYIGEKFIW